MAESKEVPIDEFEEFVRSWVYAYGPISMRQIEAWTEDLVKGLERLPYRHSVHGHCDLHLKRLFAVECALRMKTGNYEIVYADLRRLWSKEFAVQMTLAIHSKRPIDEGIEFVFAGLDADQCYLTGCVAAHGMTVR